MLFSTIQSHSIRRGAAIGIRQRRDSRVIGESAGYRNRLVEVRSFTQTLRAVARCKLSLDHNSLGMGGAIGGLFAEDRI